MQFSPYTDVFVLRTTYEMDRQAAVKDTYAVVGIESSNFAQNKIPIVDIVHIQ
jgi:hypothetical protein